MTMIRKQIYLDPDTDRAIKREARRRRISEAAVIRERLHHECASETDMPGGRQARADFIRLLDRTRREARKYAGKEEHIPFDREELYEKIERIHPR